MGQRIQQGAAVGVYIVIALLGAAWIIFNG
jgi:hypothetical protein